MTARTEAQKLLATVSPLSEDASAVKMSDADFARASALVAQLTGIIIKEHKREMMQSRLGRRLRNLGLGSYAEYLDYVGSDAGRDEIGEMINAVTTNLTAFFRERHHFEHLQEQILDPAASSARVRLWSSACSSGEEPYSIVMTVLGSKAAQHRDLKLLATDLDTNMLARARAGRYPKERLAPAAADMLASATRSVGPDEMEFTEKAKSFITFNQLNLLGDWPVKGPFDAIFCRNVLIYFELDVKKRIVDRMARLIRPDGALYLGHSESLLGDHPMLVSEGRTIYRRRP